MSPARARRMLFVVLVGTLPVPFYAVATGWAPVAWVCMVAGVTAAAATTGGGAVTTVVAQVLAVQAVAALLIAWGIAWGVARLAARHAGGAAPRVLVALALLSIAAALLLAPYRTPIVHGGAPANLIGIFR